MEGAGTSFRYVPVETKQWYSCMLVATILRKCTECRKKVFYPPLNQKGQLWRIITKFLVVWFFFFIRVNEEKKCIAVIFKWYKWNKSNKFSPYSLIDTGTIQMFDNSSNTSLVMTFRGFKSPRWTRCSCSCINVGEDTDWIGGEEERR